MACLRLALLTLVALTVGLLAGARDGIAGSPPTFTCNWDSSCPEITVAGDPLATLGGGPSPYRGYGDPSLERDPMTGTIWMTYSWLELLVSSPGPPPVADFGVETHLARSDDGGQTFTFARTLNGHQAIQEPGTGADGWTSHEVSTITRRMNDWETLWLTYFDPFGPAPFRDVYYTRTLAPSPDALGDTAQPWIDGYGTAPVWGAVHDLSAEISQLSDCAIFTEPALLTYAGQTYLATNCVVFVDGVRRPDLERLVLLREDGAGYTYLGVLLDYQDALDLGGERIEQADLAVASNGGILLIATAIQNGQPEHMGCDVFEVTDLATAQVRRDVNGAATVLMSIEGDASDSNIGPGLCTYDAASATGVVMVLHQYTADPLEVVFSMRATGLHPQGLDTDGDGRADAIDTCPLVATPWVTPAGDSDCDGFSDARESFMVTSAGVMCAATAAPNDEGTPDAWPADFNDDQDATILDVSRFSAVFGSMSPGPPYAVRYDFNGDGRITITDVSQYSQFFGKSCAP
jgi:hypothetical protein